MCVGAGRHVYRSVRHTVEVLFLFYSYTCARRPVCACGHMWVSGICLLCLCVTFVDFVSHLLRRCALCFNDAYILSPVTA